MASRACEEHGVAQERKDNDYQNRALMVISDNFLVCNLGNGLRSLALCFYRRDLDQEDYQGHRDY